jgi:signal transduction histidine kinase
MLQDNSRIGLGHSGEAYLVGGDFQMRSASRFIHGSLLRVPVKSKTASLALKGGTGASVTDDYRGIRVFSAYEPLALPGLNWIVLAEIDYEEAMVPVTGLRNDILLVSLIISLFILGFAQVITKMVTQPIIQLKKAAASLGEGNFDHKVSIRSKDEIGSLADTFNTMSDQLREERHKRILALFDGQEMERRRISRELHDGLGQKLVGTKLQIENCDEDDPACLRKTMRETKSGLHAIVEELRRISNDLMPASLDELGLETALRNLCSDVSRQSGIEVDFDANLTDSPSGNTAVYLFRIAQEGIHNIIKHANTGSISMQLIETRESLLLILGDDGIGFNPAQIKKGNGLSNMKERAGLLCGTFSVESEPGKGTTIRVKIPRLK